MLSVRIVNIDDIRDFRIRYLLGGRPVDAVTFPGDFAHDTIHLSGYLDGTQVGVASFFVESSTLFSGPKQSRLRMMATATNTHRSGYGKQILQTGIDLLRARGDEFLWCYAREAAFGFYEKMGFRYHSELFDVTGVGPHKIMALALG